MKEYLLYGQVQRRLDEHMARFGAPFSFFDAVVELWREGAHRRAPGLPTADFESWDVSDVDAFARYMDRVPVDLDYFFPGLRSGRDAITDSRKIPLLDVLPMRIAENQSMGLHRHESFEMLYVMKGSAKLYLNGPAPRGFTQGGLCLVAPGFLHDIIVDGPGEVVTISFEEHTIENTLYKLLKTENVVADFFRASLSQGRRGYMLFNMPPTQRMLLILRTIFHEGYSRQEYAREICASYIEILFSYLIRSYAREYERYSESRDSGSAPPFLSIVKYIQDNYKTTSLHETAALFHYEPSYLGKRIKLHMGKNYTEIINDLRMADAKELLRGTDLSVERVAEEVGFQSLVHFSRSFRRYAGLTPSAYRRQSRGDGARAEDRKC